MEGWGGGTVMASMIVGGIFTAQLRQSMQLRFNGGQLIAQCKRKETFCGTVLSIVRADLTPAAQQTIFVARLGTEITQALAEVGDTHRGVRIENQSEFANNYRALLISSITLRTAQEIVHH